MVRHDAESASRIRHDVAAALRAEGLDLDSVDDVVLAVGELIGNAVRHAAGIELDVTWELAGDEVHIRVRDGSAQWPRVLTAAPDETSGRGMAIVDALASAWGVEPHEDGKTVWATVPVRRTS